MTVAVFNAKAPAICRRLMADFPALTPEDTFAILGNLGHESGGLTAFQEINPTVHGSAGGWGWAQWTGMSKTGRRHLFNEWCAAQHITDLKSDEANYGFLRHELQTTYKRALTAVHAAATLYEKVVAFERVFEGAGVKGYDSRVAWAKRAQEAFGKLPATSVTPAPAAPVSTPKHDLEPTPGPAKVPSVPSHKTVVTTGVTTAVTSALAYSLKVGLIILAVVAVVAVGTFLITKSRKA